MADFNLDGKSWGGTLATIVLFKITQTTKNDVMFFLGVASALVTIGYTAYKWYLLSKQKRVTKNLD